jgi:glycosyltransferase involved in cell wall biosynthesis
LAYNQQREARALNVVLFTHPHFLPSQSMPRFARMLQTACERHGHSVQVWTPHPCIYRWVPQGRLSKWAGYVDQYLIFPLRVRQALRHEPDDTLFVFCDQALGPWVPLVKHRPHVVHAHDLLALRSALGEFPQNRTSLTGRIYQRYIRRGFSQARKFICISGRTLQDLQRVGGVPASYCEVVHNGLNQHFAPVPMPEALALIGKAGLPLPEQGLVLHVSGSQWYKNVAGVLAIYACYASDRKAPLPLWLVGVKQTEEVRAALAQVPPQGQVRFLYGIDHDLLQAVYSMARTFLFPSFAEGFGWPIVEAQACGCPVITTDDAPMNEIGGPEAIYLPRLEADGDLQGWACHGSQVLTALLEAQPQETARRRLACQAWAQRFEPSHAISRYLHIYETVLAEARSERAVPNTLRSS